MRYIRIFFLTLQSVFEERARSFVWFIISLINPLLMLLFWRGSTIGSNAFSLLSSYYFLLMIGGSLLMSHSEENIGLIDIQEGRLGTYLLKPFYYFALKWLEELPYRIMQTIFAIVAVSLLIFIFRIHIVFVNPLSTNFFLALIIVGAAITLAQIYKMCLGFISFWATDAYGIFQFSEMLILIFAGFLIPLSFYPTSIAVLGYILPFAYMIYFPVASFTGIFTTQQLILILCGQFVWIAIMVAVYRLLWKNGVRLFTGVGQ